MATTGLHKKPKAARVAARNGKTSLAEIRGHFNRLEKGLRVISDRLERVDRLNRPLYRVKHPFTVVIASEGDEFIASWFDANIHASGETEEQALAGLKSVILDAFDRLSEMTGNELGPGLRKQRDFLRAHVTESGR